jgi:hypothetical protein
LSVLLIQEVVAWSGFWPALLIAVISTLTVDVFLAEAAVGQGSGPVGSRTASNRSATPARFPRDRARPPASAQQGAAHTGHGAE